MSALIKIGTRGSPLALAQAEQVKQALLVAHAGLAVEIIAIKTTGDNTQASDQPLMAFGNKGLWTKEIEQALLAGEVDIAVHSMKDVPTVLPPEAAIVALLPRADMRDAFFSNIAPTLDELPMGAVVGTSSLRRTAEIKYRRPDLRVVNFRGNVETRLNKLAEGMVDATILAKAGLDRLGLSHKITSVIEPEVMLPAVAQGAIGIEARINDGRVAGLLAAIHCRKTEQQIDAERALLAILDGSCRTPIAALAEHMANGQLRLRALVAKPDGSEIYTTERMGTAHSAAAMGSDAGSELKRRLPLDFFTVS